MFLKRFFCSLALGAVLLPWNFLAASVAWAQLRLPSQPASQPAPQPATPALKPQPAAEPAPRQPQAKPAPRQIITLDRIVAVINDEVITRNDLSDRVRVAELELRRQGTPAPARPVLERQVLERMISDRAQVHFAKENGLRVDDVELDRALGRIADDNKLSLSQLREAVANDGMSFAKFREDIRGQIMMARLREREVDDKIVITEGEVDNMLANPQIQQAGRDEFDVSHILVRVPENARPDQIQERLDRLEQALVQLKAGSDFRQIAATYSESPDALQGGAMGWRDGEKLPTLFFDALRNMKPGETSGILRSPNGFHILRLNNRRGSTGPTLVEQTSVRHILIKANELVSDNEARNRLRNLKERIENKGDFSQLARANSEDTSASKGGDLGWISPGDTVPEFERAMNALKPGQVSEPVRSPFGWHLIQVIERRSADLTKDRSRLAARQALRERKSIEAYEEWVRQLRDRAYVEVRLDER